MVIQAEPVFKALQAIQAKGAKVFGKKVKPHVVYLSPQGRVLDAGARAEPFAARPWLVLSAGITKALMSGSCAGSMKRFRSAIMS